jgi:type VII secretion-associated protein (TIGR03931 family)
MMRLAVELGAPRIQLAVANGPEEPAYPLPSAPASVPALDAVRTAARRYGGRLEELVAVHPPEWAERTVRAAAAELAGCAASIRTSSSALATAREVIARTQLPPGPLAVLHLGPDGARATVLPAAGLTTASTGRPPPGRCSRAADPVAALTVSCAAAGIPPYALTGGVLLISATSAPSELVERLTDLVGAAPRRLTEAEDLAVLGALRPAPGAVACRTVSLPAPAPIPDGALAAGLLPAPHPPRSRAAVLAVPTLAAVLAGVLSALLAGPISGMGNGLAGPFGTSRQAQQPSAGGVLAQYDYSVRLPAGWQHSGGLPERRRTLLTPTGGPNGSDLISIEQTPLGYDSAAERDRAFRELRDRYQQARDAGADLAEFTLSTRVAGRDVIAYRQRQPRLGAEVEWYVLFEGDDQLSVGCQHTPRGAETVRAACAEVVGSLRVRS